MTKPFHVEERAGMVDALSVDILLDMHKGEAFKGNIEMAKHLIVVHGFTPKAAASMVSYIMADALEHLAKSIRSGVQHFDAVEDNVSTAMGKILDALAKGDS